MPAYRAAAADSSDSCKFGARPRASILTVFSGARAPDTTRPWWLAALGRNRVIDLHQSRASSRRRPRTRAEANKCLVVVPLSVCHVSALGRKWSSLAEFVLVVGYSYFGSFAISLSLVVACLSALITIMILLHPNRGKGRERERMALVLAGI